MWLVQNSAGAHNAHASQGVRDLACIEMKTSPKHQEQGRFGRSTSSKLVKTDTPMCSVYRGDKRSLMSFTILFYFLELKMTMTEIAN